MTNMELFKQLYFNDLLEPLIKKKFLSPTISKYYTYYLFYDKALKTNTINQSVLLTASNFKVDERTIWRAIKIFKN